ncbi:MAG: hypothetical protein JWM32_201 [Verrucomicrobia bacterium]|nr:hypothetical protein [Verrucomicrobiota bacterium]
MQSLSSLSGPHLRTYNTLIAHPLSHNLEWRAVHSLFAHLGQITEEPNGNFKVIRNGHTVILPPPRSKDVDGAEGIMNLRHFLERSEVAAAEPAGSADAHWLLVIDHHEARIFRTEMKESAPQVVTPHRPEHHFRHEPNSKDFSRGQEKPALNSYFEPVVKALETSGSILVFGTGTGSGSEMEQFLEWLKQHHPAVSLRVVGSLAVDEHHLTEGQLLAHARTFYTNLATPVA